MDELIVNTAHRSNSCVSRTAKPRVFALTVWEKFKRSREETAINIGIGSVACASACERVAAFIHRVAQSAAAARQCRVATMSERGTTAALRRK